MARRNREKQKKKTVKKILLKFIGILILLGIIAGIILGIKFTNDAKAVIDNTTSASFKESNVSCIYYDDEKLITKLSNEPIKKLTYIEYDQIPTSVINSFVAIEDRSFWTNSGIDLKGIARVGVRYVLTFGKELHGASTITQQLARNVFLSQEITAKRKVKEIFLAIEINKKYSKKDIMEFYVNNIYFANGCYGIEAASEFYFGKHARDLTLSEATYLCAIPNSPSYYDPIEYPTNAIERQTKILSDMKDLDYITQNDYDTAINQKVKLDVSDVSSDLYNNFETTYSVKCAAEYLMKQDGFDFKYKFGTNDEYEKYQKYYADALSEAKDKLYAGGYKIYTSLNKEKQQQLQDAIDDKLKGYPSKSDDGIYRFQGAATAIDNRTGNVIAIVGGRNQDDINVYTLNRACQSFRQPGSSIKPLVVYTPALENGYSPNSSLHSVNMAATSAPNVDPDSLSYYWMYLKYAVQTSNNGAAWWLFCHLSTDECITKLSNMEFTKITQNDYNAATALGGLTYGTTTEEMAGAYSALANRGVFKSPTCITAIIDPNGEQIYKEDKRVRVYDKKASKNMTDILEGVVKYGTASTLYWSSVTDIPAMGKTGTTDDNKDGWFCGATPYYTISVWVGYDIPKSTNALYGASYPLKIWKSAMSKYVKNKSYKDFSTYAGAIANPKYN